MSHFSVAVFTDNTVDIEDLLAPYQENNMGDCPAEYLKFHNLEEEYLDEYRNGELEYLTDDDITFYHTWDESFKNLKYTFGSDEPRHIIPDGYKKVTLAHRYRYSTFDEFVNDYHGCTKDEEMNAYGYWENPNAKWDWYEIGGRWSEGLKTQTGEFVNSGRICDLDFSPDPVEYDKAYRFWELYIEKDSPKDEKEETILKHTFWKESYYTDRYQSKEDYAEQISRFETFAVITPDGEWHEKGEMGWWGCSSETPEEASKWTKTFTNNFIKTANPEWMVTIVDCHI